jgi:hypothetical protein
LGPSIKLATASSIPPQNYDSDHSSSTDSSIEEIEAPDKSSIAYGPAIPSNLSSRPKTDNDNTSKLYRF